MSRKLWPRAALAMVAMIGAGCSNDSAENGNTGTGTGTASSSGTTSSGADKKLTAHEKAVKFAKGKVSANPRKDRHSFGSSAASTHRPGGTSSGSPKLESSSGPRKVVISAIPSLASVSTEMLRGSKASRCSSQR